MQSYGTQIPLAVRIRKAMQRQQRSERSLLQQIDIWQTILQFAPVAYLEVDSENDVDWYNTQAALLLNLEPWHESPQMRRSLLQVIRSYELDQMIAEIRQEGTPRCRNWTFHVLQNPQQTKDLPVRGSGFLLENGHVGVFLEDRWEAIQLMDERDRWTSDVAHELKTPLTSIRLLTETLQTNVDPTLQPWMDRLIQETVRLSVLVKDILELSHITFQNAQALNLAEIDLADLIQTAWMKLEPLAQSKNLSLYYDGPDFLPIYADRKQLVRVMLNLIDNSIKFSPMDQVITIHVCPHCFPSVSTPLGLASQTRGTQIDVIDVGTGFPEESLDHVFKRFYKADSARGRSLSEFPEDVTPLGGGSGLGLAIAQQIITAHGGIIEAKNHPEQGGAWIQIFLPHQV
jgi:two-component system, OmpR family, phosphate regulon sensor histidine kinase PhoR